MKKRSIKTISTYEEFIQDDAQRILLEKECKELLISEFMHAAMAKDAISVRRLAKEIGISPTTIQELRSGKHTNVTLDTLAKILDALGYQLAIEPKGS